METNNATIETVTIINRKPVAWKLSKMETGELLRKDLISRGWDGENYQGISIPKGRQVVRHALFLRCAKTGRFVPVIMMR